MITLLLPYLVFVDLVNFNSARHERDSSRDSVITVVLSPMRTLQLDRELKILSSDVTTSFIRLTVRTQALVCSILTVWEEIYYL